MKGWRKIKPIHKHYMKSWKNYLTATQELRDIKYISIEEWKTLENTTYNVHINASNYHEKFYTLKDANYFVKDYMQKTGSGKYVPSPIDWYTLIKPTDTPMTKRIDIIENLKKSDVGRLMNIYPVSADKIFFEVKDFDDWDNKTDMVNDLKNIFQYKGEEIADSIYKVLDKFGYAGWKIDNKNYQEGEVTIKLIKKK